MILGHLSHKSFSSTLLVFPLLLQTVMPCHMFLNPLKSDGAVVKCVFDGGFG